MTAGDTDQARMWLTDRLHHDQATVRALEFELGRLAAAAESSNADDEHDPEGATLAFERQLLVAQLDQARQAAEEDRRALERVSSGAYGTCEGCGRPISAERLAARPWARTCIACAV